MSLSFFKKFTLTAHEYSQLVAIFLGHALNQDACNVSERLNHAISLLHQFVVIVVRVFFMLILVMAHVKVGVQGAIGGSGRHGNFGVNLGNETDIHSGVNQCASCYT